jgi:hypothetical protein
MVNRDYRLHTRTIPAPAPLPPPPPPLRPRTYTVTQHLKNQTFRHIQKSVPVRRINGHNESRGLERQWGGEQCYRLSALQCLLHLPRAQRWLLQHDVAEYDALGNFVGTQNPCIANPRDAITGMSILAAPQDCMACAMKRLIDRCWGNHLLAADGTLGHLAANDSILRETYRVAITNPSFHPNPVQNPSGNFVLDAGGNLILIDQKCDAEELLTYLLDQCRGASIGNVVPDWNSTYEALFEFTFEERRYCSTCQTRVPPDPNPTIEPPTSYRQRSVGFSNMPIDRTNTGTVADAINNKLADEASPITRHCPSCNSGQLITKRFRIDSAPEYMLVKFNPMYNAAPSPPPPPAPPGAPDMRKITNHNELPRIERRARSDTVPGRYEYWAEV